MQRELELWESSKTCTALHTGQIHLWRVSLDLDETQRAGLLALLSEDELEKAQRFHFEKDQNHFIAARGILRRIIGMYLNLPPQYLQFEYSTYGKPMLDQSTHQHNLHFNLSHAKQLALYAFADHLPLGIDLEWIRDELEYHSIARHFFSAQEIQELEKIPESEQKFRFFQYWTRKEALIKGQGKGLGLALNAFDVSQVGTKEWHPVALTSGHDQATSWYVQDLFPAEGYCAAIAAMQPYPELRYWQYEW